MTNPLLSDWNTPFELPPFADIEDTHFEPALEATLTEARAAIESIATNEEPPSFENTIEAFDDVIAEFFASTQMIAFQQHVSTDAEERARGRATSAANGTSRRLGLSRSAQVQTRDAPRSWRSATSS